MKTISEFIKEDNMSMNPNSLIDELNTIIRYEYEMSIDMIASAKKDSTAMEIADKIINYFGYRNLEKIYTKTFDVDVSKNRTHIKTDIKDRILMNIPYTK
jgi:hypothetical protein